MYATYDELEQAFAKEVTVKTYQTFFFFLTNYLYCRHDRHRYVYNKIITVTYETKVKLRYLNLMGLFKIFKIFEYLR